MAAHGSDDEPRAARRGSTGGRAPAGEPEYLVVGHVAKLHGTRGEVFVWPLTDEVEDVYAPGREVWLGNEEGELEPGSPALVVERHRPFKRGLLVKFEGYDDRTSVEPLARRYLLAPIESLRPLEEGEVYYHQLLGCEVVTRDGEVVGRVREVYDTEPADLLEVKGGGRSYLIPFVERIVEEVDVDAGRIVINPPPGLLDL
ncbi:MAG TPA: ribosome maturation factor RimM [Longimicrobiales bacterium]